MTIEIMKTIAQENGGTIPAGFAMTMTDLEIKKAIKHGYLKEAPSKPEKVQAHEPEKKQEKAPAEKAPEKPAEEKKPESGNAITGTGSTFTKEEKENFRMLDDLIYDRMQSMQKSSFDIAFAVYGIYTNYYFKIDGYKNIYEYASERYGIARGTTNNFINMVDRFCVCGEENGKPVYQLKDEYTGYSSTQLICMLGHTDDELKEKAIKPDMSSRAIKKALKNDGDIAKGEEVNTLNGGGSSSKKSGTGKDADGEETGNGDSLNELRANVIAEFGGELVKDSKYSAEDFEGLISELLADKVKVICKLLKSGHTIQILDILP